MMTAEQPADQQKRFVAAHTRSGEQVYRVQVPHEYSLDEAAKALARVFPSLPRRFGRNTVFAGLQRAAASQFDASEADPKMVRLYRDKLVELGVFEMPGKRGSR